MNKGAIIAIVIGLILILFPEIIAYILGFIFILIGIMTFVGSRSFSKKTENNDYFKFGEYKIYKNKK